MTNAPFDGQTNTASDAHRALLAVSEAIISHRDLSALFHELAGRLHQVVRFDYLALILHEAASDILRLHVLEPPEPALVSPPLNGPLEESPAGLVWQSKRPLIISDLAEEKRWPPNRFVSDSARSRAGPAGGAVSSTARPLGTCGRPEPRQE